MPSIQKTKEFSASMLLKAVRRRKAYVFVPTVALTSIFTIFALHMPERYRSQAMVAVESAVAQNYVSGHGSGPPINIQEQMRSIRETLFSRPVLESVVSEFNLSNRDENSSTWLAGIERLPGSFKLYAQSKPVHPAVADRAVENLRSKINIQVEGIDAFYITYEGEDPHQVMDVTNRLAELFTKSASAIREKHAEDTSGFMDSEVARLRKRMAEEDDRIKSYRQRAVHELPEQVASNMRMFEVAQDQIQARAEKIAGEQARRAAIQEEMKELEKEGFTKTIATSKDKSPSEQRLEELRLRHRELQTRYTPNHPELARMEKEIKDLERTVGRGTTKTPSEPSPTYMRYVGLRGELQAIDQRIRSYTQEQREQTAQRDLYKRRVESSPQHERIMAQLLRDSEITHAQYNALIEKQNNAKLDERLEKTNKGLVFKVVEPARLPSAPYTPHRDKMILAGFLASLGIGLLAAFVVEHLDTSFENIDDFQAFTNLPVLTVVPSIPSHVPSKANGRNGARTKTETPLSITQQALLPSKQQLEKNRIVTLAAPGSIPAEQYGILAMKVRQRLENERAQIIVVTSAAGGEGKTLTAANLGIALSAVEGRVLLMDTDLRRPRVHEYLGLKQPRGFGELLQKPEDDISSYATKIKDLFIVPGGASVGNPIAALASRRAREIFTRLREQFRYIVLDCPPILPLADSHVLAGLADGVVLVVRAQQTRRELFQRAVESFEISNVLGVVLNDVDYQHSPYTYAYEYYQKHYPTRQ